MKKCTLGERNNLTKILSSSEFPENLGMDQQCYSLLSCWEKIRMKKIVQETDKRATQSDAIQAHVNFVSHFL